MKAFKLRATLPTEDQECQSLWQWAQVKRFEQNERRYAVADFLIMIPNGAYLGGDLRQRHITMARLKRSGFRNGVSDYFFAIARNGKSGLWLEMKRRQLGVISSDQAIFQYDMTTVGYAAVICRGWEEASKAIEAYLQG